MPYTDSIISIEKKTVHPVLARRRAREWSQAALARRAGFSRAAVSAIEGERLTPSVTAALSLAAVPECSVEERLVHVAGLHRSTAEHPDRNVETVRTQLGEGHHLLRVAQWEEGVALPVDDHTRSPDRLARSSRRWAARESGSAARECLDELLGGRHLREALRGGSWIELPAGAH